MRHRPTLSVPYAVSRSDLSLRGAIAVVFVALGATACRPSSDLDFAVTVAELASPAGQGSGESRLSVGSDGLILSWLEAREDEGHDLRLSFFEGEAWSAPRVVTSSASFFVNWADFPSVSESSDGALYAHWLARGEAGGYDYGVRVARSTDRGLSWSEPWTPHDDDSPTEHGFVSTVRHADRLGFAWLDGRAFVPGPDGAAATREMSLRYREVGPDGTPGPEMLVDGRVCDCCQTASAMTTEGPVVVYRDRTEEEIRDIYIARLVDGVWTPGRPVSEDGWHITGCPVNGPAVVADGRTVAVAWFTAPDDVARAKVAFSSDAGASFAPPITIDDGNPMGRVDLVLSEDGTAIVSWLEAGTGGAEVRVRRVSPDGTVSPSSSVTRSSAERASGFPQLVRGPSGSLMMSWTDVGGDQPRVRVARIDVN